MRKVWIKYNEMRIEEKNYCKCDKDRRKNFRFDKEFIIKGKAFKYSHFNNINQPIIQPNTTKRILVYFLTV